MYTKFIIEVGHAHAYRSTQVHEYLANYFIHCAMHALHLSCAIYRLCFTVYQRTCKIHTVLRTATFVGGPSPPLLLKRGSGGPPPETFEILHCCRWVLAHFRSKKYGFLVKGYGARKYWIFMWLRGSGVGQSPLMVWESWNCKKIVEIYKKSLSLPQKVVLGCKWLLAHWLQLDDMCWNIGIHIENVHWTDCHLLVIATSDFVKIGGEFNL